MKRPLFLSLSALFCGTIYGIFSLILLAGLFFVHEFTAIIQEYTPNTTLSATPIALLLLAGFILHSTAIWGVFLMVKMRSAGYFLFAIPSVLLAVSQLFRVEISWIFTSFYMAMIVLFGIFYRKFDHHRPRDEKETEVRANVDTNNTGV